MSFCFWPHTSDGEGAETSERKNRQNGRSCGCCWTAMARDPTRLPTHKRENRNKIEIRERGVCVCCRCDCIERRAAPTNAAVAGERAKNKRLNHIRFSSIDCRCCAGIALDAGLDGLFSSSSSSFTTAKVYFILRGALALFQRGWKTSIRITWLWVFFMSGRCKHMQPSATPSFCCWGCTEGGYIRGST